MPAENNVNSYDPSVFWEKTHSEVQDSKIGQGEGIRSVGGGANPLEAKFLYNLRKIAMKRALGYAKKKMFLPKEIKVFEFGCGSGFWMSFFSEFFERLKIKYHGADISPTAVRRLEKRFPESCFVNLQNPLEAWAKIESLKPFDLCLAIDVLYHITNDEIWKETLRRISSVTSPGGLFIFSDFGYPQPQEHPGQSHVKHRGVQSYLEELDQAGMTIVKILPVFYFHNRISSGPWKDFCLPSAIIWRFVSRFRCGLQLFSLIDQILTPLLRPMNPKCKNRFFICQRS